MKKYQVKVLEVYATLIEVEAESEQDAQSAAQEIFEVGYYPDGSEFSELPEPEYDYTLPRDEWIVWQG